MALTPQFIDHAGANARLYHPLAVAGSADNVAAGSAGAASILTITGQTGRNVIISQIAWSYSSAPTNGGITIKDSAGSPVTYFNLDITAAGPDGWTFSPPLSIAAGLNAVITLAAPGGSIQGRVYANGWVQS